MTGLDLSYLSELSGPIPSDISALVPLATSIDLSGNKFSGDIPAALGNCSYLISLKLDNNTFSGQIPQELVQLNRISYISFANNKLTGQVPAFRYGSATVDSYANDRGLGGGPLPACSLDNRPMGFHQSFKDGLIVGFAFSFTSVVVAFMSYLLCTLEADQKQPTKQSYRTRQVFSFHRTEEIPNRRLSDTRIATSAVARERKQTGTLSNPFPFLNTTYIP